MILAAEKHSAGVTMADLDAALLWYRDSVHVWQLGRVVGRGGMSVSVVPAFEAPSDPVCSGDDVLKIAVQDTRAFDPTHGLYTPNIADISDLNEAPLLHLLRRRFEQKDIYVRTAVVVVPRTAPASTRLRHCLTVIHVPCGLLSRLCQETY